jgi:ABC-2 type transport system permease protein
MYTRSTWTLFRKEVRRFTEVWTQTLAAPIVSNLLFLIVFGSVIGSRMEATGDTSYLQVLVPGLAAMGLMLNSFGNPMGSLMVGKYTNAIHELLTWPLKGGHIVLAYMSAAIIRGVLVALVTLAVGAFFTPVLPAEPWWIIIFGALMGASFASLGIIVGVVSKTFDQSAVIQNFILTPLIYLGGVFYAIGTLPPLFQAASKFNPIFYMVDGFRRGFLGTGDASVWVALAVVGAVTLVLFSGASWMFATGYKLRS